MWALWLPLTLLYPWSTSGVVDVYETPHECYVQPGDVLFGFVARIRTSWVRECGTPVTAERLGRTEAFIYAINELNSRSDILPNITIGFVVIDSCVVQIKYLYAAASLYFFPDDDMESPWNVTGNCLEQVRTFHFDSAWKRLIKTK